MTKERSGPATMKWWTTWAHDDGRVIQAAEAPEPDPRDDGRPGVTFGPYESREKAEKRLQEQHSRCLNSIVNGRVG